MPYAIDWVEQPTLADDIEVLAEVRANTSLTIMVESSIASFAGLHLTTAKRVIESHELIGPWMIKEDVVAQSFNETEISVENKPGLGLTVDEQLLQKVVRHSVTVSII